MNKIFILTALFSTWVLLSFAQTPGSLDLSFNASGKVYETHWNVVNQETEGRIALRPDGKILSFTNFYDSVSTYSYPAIARYEADGTLDTTFSNSGIRILDSVGIFGLHAVGRTIALQNDGKILMTGGIIYFGIDSCMFVARFMVDGSLDTTFGTNGLQFFTLTYSNSSSSKDEYPYNLTLQSDGKILISGLSASEPFGGVAGPFYYFVVRLNTDGTYDNSWNTNGRLLTPISTLMSSWDGRICPLKVQQDDKIVIGTSESHPHPQGGSNVAHIALMRFMPNGVIDSTFDGDGIVQTIINPTKDFFCTDLQLQTD